MRGETRISGAKNSALPILAACLLVGGVHTLENCPKITDVEVACQLLQELGCAVTWEDDILRIDSRGLAPGTIRPELLRAMRASILFQGALYARFGEGELAQPGGCPLGERPIDLHLHVLQALGGELQQEGTRLLLRKRGPDGGFVQLRYPSVGATENALLAAAAAGNDSVLCGCACEPEVCDLARFLERCGCEITGAGSRTIFVQGGRVLHGAHHSIIPDRMEALSFLCACLSAGGEITLLGTDASAYASERELLEAAGCRFLQDGNRLQMTAPERPEALPLVVTGPYPRFSTDAQPLLLAALLRAKGVSRFCETVFERRFGYVQELQKLGAHIQVMDRYARLEGGAPLRGCALQAEDLRGAAALLIAALGAEGESTLRGLRHLRRGYANFPERLQSLGAAISWEIES